MMPYNTVPNPPAYCFPQFFARRSEFTAPLDLSLRPNGPITPPSTPSPPRKKFKYLDTDMENAFWKIRSKNITVLESEKIPNKDTNYFSNWPPKSQCFETISIDNKKYFQNVSNYSSGKNQMFPNANTIEPTQPNSQNSPIIVDEYIDIISTEDENCSVKSLANTPNYVSSLISEDSDNETDSNIDVESLNDSISVDEKDKENDQHGVLHEGEQFFSDPKQHEQAIEGFDKLFEKNFGAISNPETIESSRFDSIWKAKNSHYEKGNLPRLPAPASKSERKRVKNKKHNVDEDKTSPVSGTIIRELEDGEELIVRKGDIDPAFNIVEITEEAKAALAIIENKIGSYICTLCKSFYESAFGLAQHRCPRILHIEYRCSECDKVFNCPANLASHKRWHKPRTIKKVTSDSSPIKIVKNKPNEESEELANGESSEGGFPCLDCGKTFRRQTFLRKHSLFHQQIISHKPLISGGSVEKYGNTGNKSFKMFPPQINQQAPQCSTTYFNDFQKQQFQQFSELYFQQRSHMSAFQYVKNYAYDKYMKRQPHNSYPQYLLENDK